MLGHEISTVSFNSKKKAAIKHKHKSEKVQNCQLKIGIYQKFLQTMVNKRKMFLKFRFDEYYGKNYAVKYKEHFNFEQQWEIQKNQQQNSLIQFTHLSHPLQITFSLLKLMMYLVTQWFSNIQFFVKTQGCYNIYQQIYMIAIGVQIVDMIQRVSKYWFYKSSAFNLTQIIKLSLNNLLCIVYLFLKFDSSRRGIDKMAVYWIIIQLAAIILMYIRASELYQCLRLMSFAIHYQFQSKLIDLLATLIIMAHFIAIILYSVTTLNQFETDWLSAINVNYPNNEFINYLYAFYFGSTTILTVGYGDISPKNPVQIGVVTLIQIFGIAMYAYLINQIGYSISSIRKERESTERDLSTLQKLKRQYKMKDGLLNRARYSIINRKPNATQLAPDQQKSLLIKFNQNLRNDISKKSMIAVVKSSLFLVIRWSKIFQMAVSIRLNHVLYSPNDIILQNEGAERLIIVRSGKLQIFAETASKLKMKKVLKTVQNTIDNQIGNNCYGFTAVISRRRPRLISIAKDFISAYEIQKHKFEQCILERVTDFQYYHQMKSKIDQTHLCQTTEIQSFQSSKQHYSPTHIFIIKKDLNINVQNPRQLVMRNKRDQYRGSKNIGDIDFIQHLRNKYTQSFQSHYFETSQKFDRVVSNDEIDKIDILSSDNQCQQFVKRNNIRKNINHQLQSSKEYSNYYPNSNKSIVLRQYQNFVSPLKQVQNRNGSSSKQIWKFMHAEPTSAQFDL